MQNEPDKNLERLIHRELRQLPELQAPSDLVARVRGAIKAKAALPWYRQPWFAWPRSWQMAGATAMLALVSGLVLGVNWLTKTLTSGVTETMESSRFGAFLSILNTLSNALVHAAKAVNPVYLACGLALIGMMYAACVALGTACYRIARNN